MTTISVRPISTDDFKDLSKGDTLQVHIMQRDGTICPGVATVTDVRTLAANGKSVDPVDAASIGQRINTDIVNVFGTSRGHTLFTTREARFASDGERADILDGFRADVFIEDADGDAMNVTPVWGSQVSLTAFIEAAAGDSDEVRNRVEKALQAEFGDVEVRLRNLKARPVMDQRVTVLHPSTGEVLAANLLEAEAFYVVPMPGITVVPQRGNIPVGQ